MKPINYAGARVLVTGGAGFIGSALVHELNRRGCDRVVISDRLRSSEKWRNLVPLRFEEYVEADDLLAALELGSIGRFNLILHLGACSSTTQTDAAYLFRNNFEFTRGLAEYALTEGSDTRFVYASSAATYGDGSGGMNDEDSSVGALSRLRPLNMYGYSKQLFDLWAARTGVLNRITGLKYFNIFGPNEAHKGEMRSLVAKAVPQILETGSIRLFRSHRPDIGDGEQRRDFLYIRDAVAMTLHLAARRDATGIFNIGSGHASSWLELTAALFSALGREPNIEFIDMPEQLRAKYQYFTRADISRLRRTGFTAPVTPLDDAIRDYVQNYLLPDIRLGDEELQTAS
ncbi:MAG: ADP-glyceromanno-heptose 6-epimerase [Gemmatimonadota bacterium]|jgi:ADP-L-glycero-D-manno-heptose 6-epimerase|nr:ADP-glyceromanno-heptose 6-epimerase [Gemmatimonadota bacterium]